jgi:hypothetical protein
VIGFLQAGKQSDIRHMLRLAVSARENRQTGQSGQDASRYIVYHKKRQSAWLTALP